MNKYIVHVKEIHSIQIMVDAVDSSHAIDKASSGDGVWIDNTMELVDSLPTEEWEVEVIGSDKDDV